MFLKKSATDKPEQSASEKVEDPSEKPEKSSAAPGDWTITVHELYSYEFGCRILSSCKVYLSPAATVDQFLKDLRNCPENQDPQESTKDGKLKPFSESLVGRLDDNYNFVSQNPNAQPNCSWNPIPSTKTIIDAGLCAGAVLFYPCVRRSD